MSHFAKVENGIVTRVIVADQSYVDGQPGYWKQTSYNTYAGKHWKENGINKAGEESDDQSKAFRKNFAGVGFTYDYNKDAFIPPKPFESWTLDETTCQWFPPISYPGSSDDLVDDDIVVSSMNYNPNFLKYNWDESVYQSDNSKGWVEV